MEWRHTVWPEAALVYSAIPKVANTAVKAALLKAFRQDVPRRNPHDAGIPYVEAKAAEIGRHYGDLLHMTVVRDPYDRFVSFWADKIVGDGFYPRLGRLGFEKGMSFADAVAVAVTIPDDETDPHLRSQSFVLRGRSGRPACDLILRFERLEQDWALLVRLVQHRTGQGLAQLARRRTSVHDRAMSYYDDGTRRAIAARYAEDFTSLGYPVDGGGTDADADRATTERIVSAVGRLDHRQTPPAVLDLTEPSGQRAATVTAANAVYAGYALGNPVGQVERITGLEKGRIADGAFDLLVVSEHGLQRRADFARLRDVFLASGRTVIVTAAAAVA